MKRLIGILFIVISAASFGTLAIFGRYAYADGMDIFTVLFLRFGISALFMIIILLLRREHFPGRRILAQLVGMGALGYVGQSFLYLTAIKYASTGLVALLLYLYPMFVFILSILVLQEKATSIKVIALILALVGPALTVDPKGGQLIGTLMAIAAALIYSIYILVGTNVMKHVSAVQSSAIIFTSAGTVYGILAFVNGAQRIGVKWEIDPGIAPLVRLAWQMRAQGKGYGEIIKATGVKARGLVTFEIKAIWV